jgi:hypothetical protein
MLKVIISLATLPALMSAQAQGVSDPNSEDISKISKSFALAITEGQAWAQVKKSSEALYLELRARGETRVHAMLNLQRIALPGVDITDLGSQGLEIRRHLANISLYTQKKDRLSEPTAVAATALTMQDVLQSLESIEMPNQIHMAVVSENVAQLRRSENLYDGKSPRVAMSFSERLDPKQNQSCKVDVLNLSTKVYFTVECRENGKDTYPVAIAKSDCSINNDRMRPLSLALQATQSIPAIEVYIWCSLKPQ